MFFYLFINFEYPVSHEPSSSINLSKGTCFVICDVKLAMRLSDTLCTMETDYFKRIL